jgi:O-antigen ligase
MIGKPWVAAWFFAWGAVASSMLILIFGAVGLHGNHIFTASYLSASIVGMACFGTTTGLRPGIADLLFIAFVSCAAISIAINPLVAGWIDLTLFAMTMAAFPAARLLRGDYVPFIRQACFWTSTVVVTVGVIVAAPALVSGWNAVDLGRPLVFGFSHAATSISGALGLLVLTFMTSAPDLSSKKGLLTIILISIATVLCAASMVRFVLIALLASLAICFVLSARDRKLCLTLALIISASIGVGLLGRAGSTAVYLGYATDALNFSACGKVNPDNSLEIRMVLVSEAIHLIPQAGPFGLGLDSFGVRSCFKGYSPHNDVLQAFVEFGWLGGASFLALILLPLVLLLKPARVDHDIRFVFLLCAFLIMLSMIYGRISGEIPLFMSLGLAGSLIAIGKRT